ncbi:3,4-dihydroxy-2-butanone 4-phosphate synthase [Altererythrobacter confluentis]|uniref:3,4-dihydroxy-2-butanone 4-phosphate synthase n=2 Tax=Allopontixanthobacter confluentis TaxID=1849021 RepID=A0A6L7GDQ9_9SPHN|nr:3,4-dihydroxy-2-butanone-4-phosphate synthase [Allopontixanthobacter confluentis]MXP13258.1 3,4-dihydroxy-2-butanone 4-phosphate synthase [Allopontixanthobacter confluentis]
MTADGNASIEDIGAHLADGGAIILAGDALRGGDIDFAMAASKATPAAINFMARHGRGLICLGLTRARAWELGIAAQSNQGAASSGRPFGVSIEARHGVETGISAYDRAHTIAVAMAEDARAADLVMPGHVFPLIAHPDGLAARRSTLEAGIALCRKFGLGEGVVLCAIMRDDGSMARADEMADFALAHQTPIFDIGTLIGE